MKRASNLIGPTVRKLRYQKKLTQEQFTALCNLGGCGITRTMVAKIESQVRPVNDLEMFVIAKVLDIEVGDLFPTGTGIRIKQGTFLKTDY